MQDKSLTRQEVLDRLNTEIKAAVANEFRAAAQQALCLHDAQSRAFEADLDLAACRAVRHELRCLQDAARIIDRRAFPVITMLDARIEMLEGRDPPASAVCLFPDVLPEAKPSAFDLRGVH